MTASGSVAVEAKARVALPSRILVEGNHDAELVEKVWGADLRLEGIVVEPLHGADDLAAVVRDFDPNPQRRLGILLKPSSRQHSESTHGRSFPREPIGRPAFARRWASTGHPV